MNQRFINRIGPLRGMLAVIVLVIIVIAPFAGGESYRSAWEVIRGAVAPALAVILAFVLTLDVLMSLIFMTDQAQVERNRYKLIIGLDLLLLMGVLLAWVPVLITRLSYYF
ncbi:MAG TPA: hypothetical protein VE844_16805 [Gammaproteobacteria bacterium]|nr:hypothetical protein [Gammaproteobacteria bacterium]HZC02944.1 hypothetical protein [Gammaproteobacteria bacterium]